MQILWMSNILLINIVVVARQENDRFYKMTMQNDWKKNGSINKQQDQIDGKIIIMNQGFALANGSMFAFNN